MQTLDLQFLDRSPQQSGIQIEPAYNCDGSLCHQPIFQEDGSLHYVAPHSHLIEWTDEGPSYYAIFCDFPTEIAARPTVNPRPSNSRAARYEFEKQF